MVHNMVICSTQYTTWFYTGTKYTVHNMALYRHIHNTVQNKVFYRHILYTVHNIGFIQYATLLLSVHSSQPGFIRT